MARQHVINNYAPDHISRMLAHKALIDKAVYYIQSHPAWVRGLKLNKGTGIYLRGPIRGRLLRSGSRQSKAAGRRAQDPRPTGKIQTETKPYEILHTALQQGHRVYRDGSKVR